MILPAARPGDAFATLVPNAITAGVSQSVIPIYAPPHRPIRLGLYGRALALSVAGTCLAVIVTALQLRPSPEGVGTHQNMGLLACSMLATTGIPCPSCGMTTSFAWFFKGHLLASLYVQPAGFLAAYLTIVVACFSLYEGLTGRPIHRMLRFVAPRWALISGVAIVLAAWGWKIAIRLMGVDGW